MLVASAGQRQPSSELTLLKKPQCSFFLRIYIAAVIYAPRAQYSGNFETEVNIPVSNYKRNHLREKDTILNVIQTVSLNSSQGLEVSSIIGVIPNML